MKDRVFRSMKEYFDFYKPKPPKPKGDKYYQMGVAIAREIIERCKENDAGIA